MSYTVTIDVVGPLIGSVCRPPVGERRGHVVDVVGQRWQHYSVGAKGESGTGTGANVCADHLYATIGFFLGLPAQMSPAAGAGGLTV